jgi:hypothetical protein
LPWRSSLTFLSIYFAANRAWPRRPKLTAADSRSSRAFTPQQEEIDIPDHTITITSSSCSPSEFSLVPETTGASPEIDPCAHVTGDSPET